MEDRFILDLYHNRDERAISESKHKYGNYCYRIAYRILENHEDAEECVADAMLRAWNAIPPNQPKNYPLILPPSQPHPPQPKQASSIFPARRYMIKIAIRINFQNRESLLILLPPSRMKKFPNGLIT